MGKENNISVSSSEKEKLNFKKILILLIQGAIIGAGGILPGVSGGILCVAFGLYMPLMQLFSNPLREIPRSWKKWMIVGIGGCIGLFVFALVVDVLFATSETMSKSLFAGLIIGTFPSLLREAENNPKKEESDKETSRVAVVIAFIIGFVAAITFFAFLSLNSGKTAFSIEPNMLWFGVCGFIIGMGFTIPGLTSSTVLIFLGLLQPMLDGALAFDFKVIIPVGIGVLLSIIMLSRLVNFVFGKFYSVAFYTVIGMVLASTVAIIPREFAGGAEIALCVVAAIVGLVISVLLDKMLTGYEK